MAIREHTRAFFPDNLPVWKPVSSLGLSVLIVLGFFLFQMTVLGLLSSPLEALVETWQGFVAALKHYHEYKVCFEYSRLGECVALVGSFQSWSDFYKALLSFVLGWCGCYLIGYYKVKFLCEACGAEYEIHNDVVLRRLKLAR